jgi:hypothetical protein
MINFLKKDATKDKGELKTLREVSKVDKALIKSLKKEME